MEASQLNKKQQQKKRTGGIKLVYLQYIFVATKEIKEVAFMLWDAQDQKGWSDSSEFS